jgi:hypothetical protein
LLDEVNAAIAAGTANRTLSGGGPNRGAGTVALRFVVDRTHPLVTLTAMIAPSPDWFVGVRGLPLIEQGRLGFTENRESLPLRRRHRLRRDVSLARFCD